MPKSAKQDLAPLAARLRPVKLEEFYGQHHLLAKDKPFYKAITQGHLHSMILWGPPGSGKTTLAKLIAQYAHSQIEHLSAVLAGVKEIRLLVEKAKKALIEEKQPTILFLDEIHRFNKAQQDVLLPHVEEGLLTLIGATTENPSFAINGALLSRARVYVLRALQPDEILQVIDHALQEKERGLGKRRIAISEELKHNLALVADGDARQALNLLEIAADLAENVNGEECITEQTMHEVLAGGMRRFDKGGEIFYDQISALHKSVRGSAPDAALYWLARMLDGGCDPIYIARRIVRMASEDIGNADPRALQLALNAWEAQERLGSPEGDLALAQAIVYLSCAAKSNATYLALQQAMGDVKRFGSLEVPLHLRNAPTKLMRELGYGKTYRYPHDEPEAYAAGEHYFPDEMNEPKYYKPAPRGLEIKVAEKLQQLKKLDEKTKK